MKGRKRERECCLNVMVHRLRRSKRFGVYESIRKKLMEEMNKHLQKKEMTISLGNNMEKEGTVEVLEML